MIVRRVASVFKATGVVGVLSAMVRRLRTPHARCYPACLEIMRNAVGMEIGGPSPMFARGGLLPLYPTARLIDNCNFAHETKWEGAIKEGDSFVFDSRKAPGRQFIAEGGELSMIESGRYDFVLSCHMLEHTANPLRALREWSRLLRAGGGLLLVVPHRDGTFDHRRPVTLIEHMNEDFERGTGEDDLTHVEEILELHDVSRDRGVHNMALRERMERNAEFRTLHHHVFDTRLVVKVVEKAGLAVSAVEPLEPYHVVVLARKPLPGAASRAFPDQALREILRKSPFKIDRLRA